MVFDFYFGCFPRLLFLSLFLELMQYFFSVENEENALEHFFTDILRRPFVGILAIELGTVDVGLVHLFSCFLQHFILALGLQKKLLAVLVYPIFSYLGIFALESLIEGDCVSFELCKLCFDLRGGHF